MRKWVRTIKFLNLINNEYKASSILSKKGCQRDECQYVDRAFCMTNAIDVCKLDYVACTENQCDYCYGQSDVKACIGLRQDITD